jgi:hypothetical protein
MLVYLLLELCICELPTLVVEICASLGVNTRVVVADHNGFVDLGSVVLRARDDGESLKWQARVAYGGRVVCANHFRHTAVQRTQGWTIA